MTSTPAVDSILTITPDPRWVTAVVSLGGSTKRTELPFIGWATEVADSDPDTGGYTTKAVPLLLDGTQPMTLTGLARACGVAHLHRLIPAPVTP